MLRRHWTCPLALVFLLTLLAPLPPFAAAAAPATTSQTTASRAAAADTTSTVPLPSLSATTTQVAYGLRRPTALAAPDDGTGRLFITEKPGTVRVYHPDTGLARTPLIDITSAIDESGNERGLLGIALPPDFAESQDVYLAYTALPDGAVTLARYRLDESRLEVLLAQEHAEYSNHNGGQLAFGPDGHLYWSIGDGGGSADPLRAGQRLDTLLGKVLRIDVGRTCGALAYCVPADNPFVGTAGARPEIWLYGLRNPWRFSFDSADGSMWIGDVGQGRWEEVDHLAPGQGGANLGWSCYEGLERFEGGTCRPSEEYTKPVFTYSPYTGGCSVIGGHVYRGSEYAGLVGQARTSPPTTARPRCGRSGPTAGAATNRPRSGRCPHRSRRPARTAVAGRLGIPVANDRPGGTAQGVRSSPGGRASPECVSSCTPYSLLATRYSRDRLRPIGIRRPGGGAGTSGHGSA
ncbi:hypothetical protein SGLAM104S_05602 [Streptomyces glaucescens]